jgi:hypothetical protein
MRLNQSEWLNESDWADESGLESEIEALPALVVRSSGASRRRKPPQWFEVSATSLGYNVSWLDRVVQILDRVILVLEQLFLSFYAWLRVLRESR